VPKDGTGVRRNPPVRPGSKKKQLKLKTIIETQERGRLGVKVYNGRWGGGSSHRKIVSRKKKTTGMGKRERYSQRQKIIPHHLNGSHSTLHQQQPNSDWGKEKRGGSWELTMRNGQNGIAKKNQGKRKKTGTGPRNTSGLGSNQRGKVDSRGL